MSEHFHYPKTSSCCVRFLTHENMETTNMFNSPNLYARDQIIASFEGEEVRL